MKLITDTACSPSPCAQVAISPARMARSTAVLAVLAQRPSATAAEIAQALGDGSKQGVKTIWQALQRLAKGGRVVKDGKQYRLAA